jgi:hypothetical protein
VCVVQADNPTPSSFGLDDDSVIDRMTAELQGASQGMAAGFKLQPVQFEKVSSLRWQLALTELDLSIVVHMVWLGLLFQVKPVHPAQA